MTPETDYTSATADTLAIIQGRESLSSMIDELDYAVYEHVYCKAEELNRSNYVAKKTDNGYKTEKHAKQWQRRVR